MVFGVLAYRPAVCMPLYCNKAASMIKIIAASVLQGLELIGCTIQRVVWVLWGF